MSAPAPLAAAAPVPPAYRDPSGEVFDGAPSSTPPPHHDGPNLGESDLADETDPFAGLDDERASDEDAWATEPSKPPEGGSAAPPEDEEEEGIDTV